jgi:hypothetical protein
MPEGSQGQAKRSPWNRPQENHRVLEGRKTQCWLAAKCLAALQGAGVLRLAFQGLRASLAPGYLLASLRDALSRMGVVHFTAAIRTMYDSRAAPTKLTLDKLMRSVIGMLDIHYVRENFDLVLDKLKTRNFDVEQLSRFRNLDSERRLRVQQRDELNAAVIN